MSKMIIPSILIRDTQLTFALSHQVYLCKNLIYEHRSVVLIINLNISRLSVLHVLSVLSVLYPGVETVTNYASVKVKVKSFSSFEYVNKLHEHTFTSICNIEKLFDY